MIITIILNTQGQGEVGSCVLEEWVFQVVIPLQLWQTQVRCCSKLPGRGNFKKQQLKLQKHRLPFKGSPSLPPFRG